MTTNANLGLPYQEKMTKYIFCFDVDGTLISDKDDWYEDIITVAKVVSKWKNVRVCIWSGGGKDYAATWGRRLGLDDYVWRYASKFERDEIAKHGRIMAIDDIQDTALGDENFIVRNK